MSIQLNPSEISELIKDRIKNFEADAEARTEGTIVMLTDGIARIHGLSEAMQGEMLEFPGNTFGLALNLEQDSVGAVILGDYKHLSEGDTVKVYRSHSRSAYRRCPAGTSRERAGSAHRRQGPH